MNKKRFVTLGLVIALTVASVSAVFAATPVTGTATVSAEDSQFLESMFDADFYAAANPDVVAACGNSKEALFKHFLNYGLKEGRQANAFFNVFVYRSAYADLREAFGNDMVAYYRHFVTKGITEGRNIITPAAAQAAGVIVTDFSDTPIVLSTTGFIISSTVPVVTNNTENKVGVITEEIQKPNSIINNEKYQKAYAAWLASKPDIVDYMTDEEAETYLAACLVWNAAEPKMENYVAMTAGFQWFNTVEEAEAAFEADHQAWEASVPNPADYFDSEAYNADYEAWEASTPDLADYITFVGCTDLTDYATKFNEWVNTGFTKTIADYPIGLYPTAEAAQAAFEEAREAYTAKQTAFGLLDPETDAYKEMFPECESYEEAQQTLEDMEPQIEDFTVGYADSEAAQAALNADREQWIEENKSTCPCSAALVDDTTYGSLEEAQQQFIADCETHTGAMPNSEADEYNDTESYNNDVLTHQENEPIASEYIVKDENKQYFDTNEEAAAAYTEDTTSWNESKPEIMDYVSDEGQEAFNEDMTNWAESEPKK